MTLVIGAPAKQETLFSLDDGGEGADGHSSVVQIRVVDGELGNGLQPTGGLGQAERKIRTFRTETPIILMDLTNILELWTGIVVFTNQFSLRHEDLRFMVDLPNRSDVTRIL